MKRLKEIFTDLFSGVFSEMENIEGVSLPWRNQITATDLDMQYLGNNSGEKIIAPLLDRLVELDNGTITAAHKTALITSIYNRFSLKWDKLWRTFTLTYNPIENYRMVETKTGTEQTTNTPEDRVETTTQKPANWKTTVEGAKTDNETETKKSVYGYDSSSPSDADLEITSQKQKIDTTQSGTFTTERGIEGTETDLTEYDTTLTRSGNIGVTTSQQMIESERELWLWDYFAIVFKDIDSVLTIPIY